MKIIVASQNPVKLEVAKQAFTKVFPDQEFEIIGVKSQSGVSDQPFDDETLTGAENRLHYIESTNPDADYWVSQEGGLCKEDGKMFSRAWILISDKTGFIGKSSTASFSIHTEVVTHIESGDELGTANDKVFGTENSKQKGGALSLLTNGILNRTDYYTYSAIIALCQIVHKDWYK